MAKNVHQVIESIGTIEDIAKHAAANDAREDAREHLWDVRTQETDHTDMKVLEEWKALANLCEM